MKKCNDAIRALKQNSEDDKSQHRIRDLEWLCNDGTGFGRLKSRQIVQSEVMKMNGSVVFSFQRTRSRTK